jgi:AcrR family transcriptional regulator
MAKRRAILDAAAGHFADRGFDGTKMASIAADAGVSLKTLYAAFSSKDELFEAVIADRFEQHVTPALAMTPGHDAAGEQVLALVGRVLDAMEADRSFFQLYVRGSEGVPAKLRAQGRDPYAKYINVFQERLIALIATTSGQTVAAEQLAAALAAAVIALARVAVTADPPRPITDVAKPIRAIFGPVLLAG